MFAGDAHSYTGSGFYCRAVKYENYDPSLSLLRASGTLLETCYSPPSSLPSSFPSRVGSRARPRAPMHASETRSRADIQVYDNGHDAYRGLPRSTTASSVVVVDNKQRVPSIADNGVTRYVNSSRSKHPREDTRGEYEIRRIIENPSRCFLLAIGALGIQASDEYRSHHYRTYRTGRGGEEEECTKARSTVTESTSERRKLAREMQERNYAE